MEMQHHSDCGLDTCNISNTMSHPPTHLNNSRKGITNERQFPSKIGPQEDTQGSRRTLKDCKVKTPPPPPAVQRLNALKSPLLQGKQPLHSTTTLAPNFLFTLKLWTCHRKFTFNDFTFSSYHKLLFIPFFCWHLLCLKLLNVTWMIAPVYF